ncbi:transcription termination factor Rho [Bifidobacterium sp. SMB2]|uniref:Transcription termination factor Rho n=1 Tax=Bifidobacterium saimiriisciurei TaxID=2661627 RepID=A0ABX0CI46_9BIFI|nr:transcription termination factor Rho [Bifidobacterium saimiriisciurei]NEG95312.1 transcription termination factor Rho [Bifidobacterium sp. SMB2]NEH12519.1 transcription termination factor Rho [Bifidobacterium saimiriisciurei]
MADSQNLADMKLPELKELAKQMGLRGTSAMRKGELLSTIEAARNGGEAPAGVTVRVPKKTKTAAKKNGAAKKTADAVDTAADAANEAPAAVAAEPAAEPAESAAPVAAADDAHGIDDGRGADDDHADRDRTPSIDLPLDIKAPHVDDAKLPKLNIELPEAKETRRSRRNAVRKSLDVLGDDRGADRGERADRNESVGKLDLDLDLPRIRRRREPVEAEPAHAQGRVRDLGDILAALPDRSDRGDRSDRADRDRKNGKRNNRDDRRAERTGRDSRDNRYEQDGDDRDFRRNRNDRNDRNDRRNNRDDRRDDRRARNRRDDAMRDERGTGRAAHDDYQQPAEDLVPVAGIIDVLESYAFVRTSGYLPGPNDVYVSMGQVKKYGLRKGDAVQGTTRPPREGGRNQRQKFVPLQSIETINGMSVEEAQQRPHFNKLTPLYPQERLRMETQPTKLTGRLIDIVAPIGKGQRGLIVSPPKAGKTITLQQIANSITSNNPEVHLMVVLVDERPEEVTDMERTVQGEVISSTFDRPATDHTIVAELAIERAKRLVELGQDVVVLLDSMTRLARAYNIAQPASGRILSGGVDAQALYPPKKFFGAARNIENGGSLTIISSALVETGSKMDEVIFEEFKGTGNMELRLSRELSEKRLFPAIDINASGTRREELITPPNELAVIYRLRRLFGGMEPEQAYQTLVPRLKKTATNREFLAAITSTIPQNQGK